MISQFILQFAVTLVIAYGVAYSVRKRGIADAQSAATTIGILGTFIGITFGLLGFDAANMAESVPQLITGLQTAFATSIAGMVVSLIIGTMGDKLGFSSGDEAIPEADKSERDLLIDMIGEIRKLNTNLVGDAESTLVTQLQKLRTSINDKQDELKKSFDEFTAQMAEQNVNALIEAITKVMADFNTKINDQLGQSFKELSDSVSSLVEWQHNYIETVKSSTEALGTAQESLVNSSNSLHETSVKVAEIAENNEMIKNTNVELSSVVQNLNAMLDASVTFSAGMKALASELDGNSEKVQKEIRAIVQESIQGMQDSNKALMDNMDDTTRRTLSAFGQHMASISEKLGSDFERIQRMLSQRSE